MGEVRKSAFPFPEAPGDSFLGWWQHIVVPNAFPSNWYRTVQSRIRHRLAAALYCGLELRCRQKCRWWLQGSGKDMSRLVRFGCLSTCRLHRIQYRNLMYPEVFDCIPPSSVHSPGLTTIRGNLLEGVHLPHQWRFRWRLRRRDRCRSCWRDLQQGKRVPRHRELGNWYRREIRRLDVRSRRHGRSTVLHQRASGTNYRSVERYYGAYKVPERSSSNMNS